MDNTIDRKEYNEPVFKEILVSYLKTMPRGATQIEMVVATGLSKDWVELAVRSLLNDYPVHLEANSKHELIYVFDFDTIEEALTSAMMLKKLTKAVWAVFTFFFKAWIIAMLFTYLLFYVLVLAFSVAALTRSSAILEEVLLGVWKALGDVFRMLAKGKDGELLASDGYVHQVFSYVFGQTRHKADDLELEKILLSFISQNKGKIVVAEIVKLTGWSIRKAQEEAAQLLANYHGDAEVTDEGVIVYLFPDLESTTANTRQLTEEKSHRQKSGTQTILPVWQRPVPHRQMNDNDKKTNESILYVNGFNWIMSVVGPFIIAYMLFDEGDIENLPNAFYLWTLVIPFVFSFVFWLIPTLRRPGVNAENQRIDTINEESQLLGMIYERLTHKVYRNKEVSRLQTALVPVGKKLVHKDLGKLLDKKAVELEAESHSDEGGMYYTFEQLKTDVEVSARLRQ